MLAFAIRHLGADAGVMVTASHNPPQDNGYKVYLGDGSQIVPPGRRRHRPSHRRGRPGSPMCRAAEGLETLGERLLADYLDAVVTVVDPASPRDLSIVHTSLHGVGHGTVHEAFVRAGFAAPIAVDEQAVPDPDFPTVAFPNPEEKGAIDLALAQAREVRCDLVIANDPDADRCAAAIVDPRPATGGCCAATRSAPCSAPTSWPGGRPRDVFANSIVSSRLLAAIARAAGIRHEETLTGFKWISRVEGLRYGYEEALGYCVAPDLVRDKDGVSAALLLAELAAGPSRRRAAPSPTCSTTSPSRTACTPPTRSRCASTTSRQIEAVMGRLRAEAPSSVAGIDVARLDDLAVVMAACPPPTGCASCSPTTRGSSCARVAPSPRSRSISRSSSRWRPADSTADRGPCARPGSRRCAPTWSD